MASTPRRHFPAFLDLDRRLAVLVGDGNALEKRVKQMLRYGADVVVVTGSPTEWLIQSEADGVLTLEQRSYVRGDLAGAFVALCATSDEELKQAVFSEAESNGCLVNITDAPALSSFVLPSVMHRGSLQIAFSTGGAAPSVAKQLRQRFEAELGEEWGTWVALLAEFRATVMERVQDPDDRQRFLEAASADEIRQRLAAGEDLDAEELLKEFGYEEATEE